MDKFDAYLEKYCSTIYAREHGFTPEEAKDHELVKAVKAQYDHENDGVIKKEAEEQAAAAKRRKTGGADHERRSLEICTDKAWDGSI